MATRLIFVHGRNQQGKDPTELRRHWFESLRAGFDGLGLDMPLTEEETIFPFFGDALHALTSDEESLDEADAVLGDDVVPAGHGAVGSGDADGAEAAAQFGREVLSEVLDGAGVSAAAIDAAIDADSEAEISDEADVERARRGGMLTWEWVHTGLTILDRFIPGASGASLAYATSDVAQYLKDDSIRAEIDGVVAAAFHECDPGDTLVVVAHSLGSVIAYNLLTHGGLDHRYDIAAFITVGSPLGVTSIRKAVSPIEHPLSVRQWFNAYDERDVVALYPLDQRHFPLSPLILNHGTVANESNNHHKIEGYLGDPTVALCVHRALVAGRLPPVLARRRRTTGDPSLLEDLTTPALIVDAAVFEANCAAMDAVRPARTLRPHVSTFRSSALARRLAADGHTSFCAATPAEIQAMVTAGLGDDLLLTNETLDLDRLGAHQDQAQITVAVDSDDTLDAAILRGIRSVLIDVDVGPGRGGCHPESAGRLAERARRAGLEVRGVMGYDGHPAMNSDVTNIGQNDNDGVERVEATRSRLLAAAGDVGGEIISGGGTATFDTTHWCTEIQAGSYCLMDAQHAGLDLPFAVALELVATVTSVLPDGRIVADAGLEAPGMDRGHPRWAHGSVLFCADHHVVLQPDDPPDWSVGDLVRLQPARLGPTLARHRALWLIEGDHVSDHWPIDLHHR